MVGLGQQPNLYATNARQSSGERAIGKESTEGTAPTSQNWSNGTFDRSKNLCYFCGVRGHTMRFCKSLERMIQEGMVHRGDTGYVYFGPKDDIQIVRIPPETLAEAVKRMIQESHENSAKPGSLDPAKEKNQEKQNRGQGRPKGGAAEYMPTEAAIQHVQIRTIDDDGEPIMANCNRIVGEEEEKLLSSMKEILAKGVPIKGDTASPSERESELIREFAEIIAIHCQEEAEKEELANGDILNTTNHRCDCVGECHCAQKQTKSNQPNQVTSNYATRSRTGGRARSTPEQTLSHEFREAEQFGERDAVQQDEPMEVDGPFDDRTVHHTTELPQAHEQVGSSTFQNRSHEQVGSSSSQPQEQVGSNLPPSHNTPPHEQSGSLFTPQRNPQSRETTMFVRDQDELDSFLRDPASNRQPSMPIPAQQQQDQPYQPQHDTRNTQNASTPPVQPTSARPTANEYNPTTDRQSQPQPRRLAEEDQTRGIRGVRRAAQFRHATNASKLLERLINERKVTVSWKELLGVAPRLYRELFGTSAELSNGESFYSGEHQQTGGRHTLSPSEEADGADEFYVEAK